MARSYVEQRTIVTLTEAEYNKLVLEATKSKAEAAGLKPAGYSKISYDEQSYDARVTVTYIETEESIYSRTTNKQVED